MQWIREVDYALTMKEKAEPYVAQRRTPGTIERIKGQPVYYEHFKADREKGIIVLSHGFTESVKKFTESIYYMLQAGYSVWGVGKPRKAGFRQPAAVPLLPFHGRLHRCVAD